MEIIDGKKIAEKIFLRLEEDFLNLGFKPIVYDILVGTDVVSASYVNIKAKAAARLGIEFKIVNFKADIFQNELENSIREINQKPGVCGIILQLPLPANLSSESAMNAILSDLDVDSMGKINLDKFYNNQTNLLPPTAEAILEILKSLPLNLPEKKYLVIGQGELVGRPVSHLLKSLGFQVDIANSETVDINSLSKGADVIISATGHSGLVTKEMIKPGAVVIDAGTSESNGAIVGDVNFSDVLGVTGYITPVPGGVGPVTVAMLFNNVLKIAKKSNLYHAKN